MSAELGTVEDRSFSVAKFRLQNGSVMPTAKIAYETYGRLAAGGRSAPLITHGPTGCFCRRSPPGACSISRLLPSMPAISRSTATSGIRGAVRNTPNDRRFCASFSNR